MDAVEAIVKQLDAELLLAKYDFDKVHNDGAMIRSCCKFHGGSNPTAFVMNVETGLWYCHTSDCGGGDAFTLVQRLEKCTFKESVNKLADLFGVDIENLQIRERKQSYIKDMHNWIRTMRNRKKKELKEFVIEEKVHEVTKFRDFKEETLRYFELGFVDKITCYKRAGGTYELTNRLTLPIYRDGKQIGVSLRSTKARDYPKWSHQPLNVDTSKTLYNYDRVVGSSDIIICEGAFDVWAYHEIGIPAVGTYGAHLADEQYKLLMRTGANLIFSYDGDEAGRKATEKARKRFANKANLYNVQFDEGEDPASIERNQLKLKYESRMRI